MSGIHIWWFRLQNCLAAFRTSNLPYRFSANATHNAMDAFMSKAIVYVTHHEKRHTLFIRVNRYLKALLVNFVSILSFKLISYMTMTTHVALNIVPMYDHLYTLQQAAVLQSAVHPHGAFAIDVYENGCDFRDEFDQFRRNCAEACTRPAVVWNNPYTIHNCLIYSTVSGLIAKDNLTQNDRERAHSLGYLSDFDLSLIENPANICMHDFCEQQHAADPATFCPSNFINQTDFSSATKGEIHTFLTDVFIERACGAFKASPNVDVGGIGVYIGYLMQLGILLYCWLHGRFMSSWIRFLVLTILSPFGLKKARQRARHMQTRLDKSHQSAALISGLVEFQQAQSYFALTLNGTAIGALTSNGAMFDVQSLQQMHSTVDLLGDVAATAVICLTFGLYMLHAANKRTWYNTIISLLAILISFATWLLTYLPLKNLHIVAPSDHNLPTCGNKSPATFCLDQTEKRKSIISESICIAICMLTTILMMIRQCSTHPFPSPRTSITTTRRTSTICTRNTTTTKLYNWRLEIAETVFATMTIMMLVQLITNGEMLTMRENVRWTFAQLIAVTIWAPSIVEYLYAAVRKWSLTGGEDVERHVSCSRGVDEGVQVECFGDYVWESGRRIPFVDGIDEEVKDSVECEDVEEKEGEDEMV